MRFTDLSSAIVSDLSGKFPALRACSTHPGRFDLAELKRVAIKTPAILVACLGVPGLAEAGTEEKDVELVMAAFVLTKDQKGLSRDISALNLVEALLVHIPLQQWGMTGLGPAGAVAAENLYGGDIDKTGVAMWAVSWRHKIRIGESIWQEDGVLPDTVYAGYEPDVGLEHEPDYEEVTKGLEIMS